MATERPAFRMGRLDHVHIRVPDRAEAERAVRVMEDLYSRFPANRA